MAQAVRKRELVAEAGDGERFSHVSFSLWDRLEKRLLRSSEAAELDIVVTADGRLVRYYPSLHWIDGQAGPAPVLLSQDVGCRYGLCVKSAGG